MINKAFSKIFKDYKKIANILNINLKKRLAELSCHDFYRITEYYEKKIFKITLYW